MIWMTKDSFHYRKLVLQPRQGLFLLETGNGIKFAILDQPENIYSELSKSEVKSMKYIGSQSLFRDTVIKSLTSEREFERTVFIHDKCEIMLNPKTGKLLFEKIARRPETNSNKTAFARRKKQVLIIDDSKTMQKLLQRIIDEDSRFEVMGIAGLPSEAKRIIEKKAPDIITLDIHMPEMNGVEFLKTYLKFKAIPTIIVTSVGMDEGPLVFEGLSNGATDYIQKPTRDNLATVRVDLLAKLEAIHQYNPSFIDAAKSKGPQEFINLDGAVFIGSSTGGPAALERVLADLPRRIPPVFIIQHIPEFFTQALASRLDQMFPFKVKVAEDRELVKEGTVYIAPGGKQMSFKKLKTDFMINVDENIEGQRYYPSVDFSFLSAATHFKGVNTVSVVLTGMGDDGAKGSVAMRSSGSHVIAQNEATCVVYGMPKAVVAAGSVSEILPISGIGQAISLAMNKMIKATISKESA